jgi:hypothetical protein
MSPRRAGEIAKRAEGRVRERKPRLGRLRSLPALNSRRSTALFG